MPLEGTTCVTRHNRPELPAEVAAYGACRGSWGVMFPSESLGVIEAKRICAICPVIEACGEYALEANEEHGIWGGMSEAQCRRERARRRRERQSA